MISAENSAIGLAAQLKFNRSVIVIALIFLYNVIVATKYNYRRKNMNLYLSDKLKELRSKKNISQEKLAQYLKVSFQAISKWENNVTMPDIMLLPLIADTLGVTIDELFGIKHKVREMPIDCE